MLKELKKQVCAANLDAWKSGLAKLEVDNLRFAKCATLEWLLTPKQLQKFAR